MFYIFFDIFLRIVFVTLFSLLRQSLQYNFILSIFLIIQSYSLINKILIKKSNVELSN